MPWPFSSHYVLTALITARFWWKRMLSPLLSAYPSMVISRGRKVPRKCSGFWEIRIIVILLIVHSLRSIPVLTYHRILVTRVRQCNHPSKHPGFLKEKWASSRKRNCWPSFDWLAVLWQSLRRNSWEESHKKYICSKYYIGLMYFLLNSCYAQFRVVQLLKYSTAAGGSTTKKNVYKFCPADDVSWPLLV